MKSTYGQLERGNPVGRKRINKRFTPTALRVRDMVTKKNDHPFKNQKKKGGKVKRRISMLASSPSRKLFDNVLRGKRYK